MRRRSSWILILPAVLLGVGLGWGARLWYETGQTARVVQLREASTKYRFIKPLLLSGVPEESPDYADLKAKFESYVVGARGRGEAESISVYFHDLNTGRWTGFNEKELYDPSSMLKVGMMVGYLKLVSIDPALLTQEFPYIPKTDFGQHYPPTAHLPQGLHTVKELLETMIIESDNVPLEMFLNHNSQALGDVLQSLNISLPATPQTTDFMSPQAYSRLFRTLYSSTYLPRGLSEYALQLLSLTTFNNGLVAGIPAGVTVAHKFGEHTTTNTAGQVTSRQLHDCGIVYYPDKPFLVCVMTRGQDFTKLEKVISGLAQLTYQHVAGAGR